MHFCVRSGQIMANMIVRLATVASVLATLIHGEVVVSFVDNASRSYLKDGSAAAQNEEMSGEDLTATMSSLLNVGALSKINAATSDKASSCLDGCLEVFFLQLQIIC